MKPGSPLRAVAISATGMYVPERILTNAHLEQMVDTSDEWIQTRTGILTRHVAAPGTPASDVALPALRRALEARGMPPQDLDLVIVTTVTPDMLFPSTACVLMHKVGAVNAWGYDLSAACSGFIYGLAVAWSQVASGAVRNAAVVGVDVLTTLVDWTNRNHCVLFGDGCGVVIVEPTEHGVGIIDAVLHADGSGGPFLHMLGGGSLNPPSHLTVDKGYHFLYQDGKAVFKVASTCMADVTMEVVERNGFKIQDIALIIPHQANLRIIEAVAKRLGIERDQVLINIDRYGNTTSATIPIGLHEAATSGRISKGDLVVLTSFGGGYTWGAILLRWEL